MKRFILIDSFCFVGVVDGIGIIHFILVFQNELKIYYLKMFKGYDVFLLLNIVIWICAFVKFLYFLFFVNLLVHFLACWSLLSELTTEQKPLRGSSSALSL